LTISSIVNTGDGIRGGNGIRGGDGTGTNKDDDETCGDGCESQDDDDDDNNGSLES